MGSTHPVDSTSPPKVTVLMAVFNGEKYLREAVDSVLAQSFTDFEFLVVNDGSTDQSSAILASYASERLRVIENSSNQGLAASLNIGLEQARGTYVARMDADDICHEERLGRQVTYMDSHPETVILGTNMTLFGGAEQSEYWRPESDRFVKAHMLFASPFAHPTVMLRTSFLRQNNLSYDPSLKCAQDYDLWQRMLAIPGARSANLSDALIRYRQHDKSITETESALQDLTACGVREREIKSLQIEYSSEEIALHHAISTLHFQCDTQFVLDAEAWLRRLIATNATRKTYSPDALDFIIGRLWYMTCHHAAWEGPKLFATFLRSPLSKGYKLNSSQWIRYAAKSMLGKYLYPARAQNAKNTTNRI